jgi:hypothetical protein
VNLSDTAVTLLGPFEKNATHWREMPYINIHDGKTHTLKPPTMPVIAQTFETVFRRMSGIPNTRVSRLMAVPARLTATDY